MSTNQQPTIYMASQQELHGATTATVQVTYLSGNSGSIIIDGNRYNPSRRKAPAERKKRVYKKRDRNEYQKLYRKARLAEFKLYRKVVQDNNLSVPAATVTTTPPSIDEMDITTTTTASLSTNEIAPIGTSPT